MRREPLLLAVAPHGLIACIGHGDDLQVLAAFAPGEEATFASWLTHRPPDEPCRMLVDLPDEAYEVEDLPRVRGSDRRALLARRLAHWFPEPRFARASALGPLPDGRKGFERVLFAGLERSTDLLPWLERLEADGRRLELLVPAASLLPRLPLPGAHPRRRNKATSRPRLIATSGRAGLRISLLGGEHTLFSRVVRGASAPITDPQSLGAEIERTRDYLVSQRRIASDAPLTRIVVDLPADAGTEHHSLPPVRVAAAGALPEGELPGGHDAHLLLSLRRAPTTIGWPLVPGTRRWPVLPARRLFVALGLLAATALGAAAWLDHQAQAEAAAAAERARAAHAAAVAAEEAEFAAREAERAALAALSMESPPPPQESTPEPAAPTCPPEIPAPPAPIARRIDGILRRPDGEILLWMEGAWQSARSLGLHPVGGTAAAVSPPTGRIRLRSGDHWPIGEVFLPGAQPLPEPARGDTAPAALGSVGGVQP